MANKKISVNLVFQSDVKSAKAAVQDLSKSLLNLQNQTRNKMMMGQEISSDLQKATGAANQLQAAMKAAINPQNGQVNMAKMNQLLKASGTSMKTLREQLILGGQAGVQAFLDLNNAILKAQVPIKRTQTMIDKMWTTLGNTVRWQISAQALQAVTSGISEAYQYAQDLDKSLNNIRIVTEKSKKSMDEFAKSANASAKALSTTTTAYTDAALIYYQQGLNDKAVKERTDTTIKLANAVGESAETVSEWMTAIWNNFDDGSKSLEYYADVLAALGAATASSADEIATGLEKFAAVAETVGLSYEYATSALTTVTAETRQSADVVGTAFKTMFARIQDLDLGKTLDDGTTLGQYSQVLQSVGVAVKDASGNLREMDDILNDLGSRWENLTQAQQVSVAQGVAGIRQYNQMLALMNNWEVFQQNLVTANAAEGALEAQQEIYADSWDAAKNRVTASAEAIYDALLNDEFFIELNNGLADALDGFSKLLEAMGGLKGLLPMLIFGISQIFGPKIVASVQQFSYEMSVTGKKAAEELRVMQAEALKASKEIASLADATNQQRNAADAMGKRVGINSQIADLEQSGKMTPRMRDQVNNTLGILDTAEQTWVQTGTNLDMAYRGESIQRDLQKRALAVGWKEKDVAGIAEHSETYLGKEGLTEAQRAFVNEVKTANAELEKQNLTLKDNIDEKSSLIPVTNAVAKAEDNNTKAQKQYDEAIKTTTKTLNGYKKSLDVAGNVNRMVSGISSATFAISSLKSAWDTLNDPDLSGPEKFLQVMMSLSMALPMVISSVQSLRKAHILETTAALLGAAAEKKAQINTERNSTAKLKSTLTKTKDTIATKLNTLAGKENNRTSIEGAAANEAEKNAVNAAAAAKEREAAVDIISGKTKRGNPTREFTDKDGFTWREIKDKKTGGLSYQGRAKDSKKWKFIDQKEGASKFGEIDTPTSGTPKPPPKVDPKANMANRFKNLGKSLWQFTKAFGPAIVLIGSAVLLGKALYNAYNKANQEFEDAKKVTAELKKNYNDVVTATNELKQSIDGFKEKQNSLDGLTKGTLEYREALLSANEEARKLIEENDLIQGQDYNIVDGQIVIDEAALDRAYEEQLNKQQQAADASATAQIIQNQKELAAKEVQTARNLNIADDSEQIGWGAGVGMVAALAAAGIATIFTGGLAAPLIAAGIAGLSAGVTGGLLLGGESGKEAELLEKLTEASEDEEFLTNDADFKKYLANHETELGLTTDMIDELVENRSSIKDLIESNKELEASNRLLYQQKGASAADYWASEGNLSEKEKNRYGSAMGAIIQNSDARYERIWEAFEKDFKDEDQLINNVAKALGLDIKTGTGNKATISGEEGKKQTEAVNIILAELQSLMYSDPEEFAKIMTNTIGYQGKTLLNVLETAGGSSIAQGANEEFWQSYWDKWNERAAALEKIGIEDNADINNILENKELEEEFDFSSIFTWSEFSDLEKSFAQYKGQLSDMDADIQTAITNFEEDKRKASIRANKDYEEKEIESTERQGVLTDLGLSQAQANAYADAFEEAYGLSEEFAASLTSTNLHFKDYMTSAAEVYKKYGAAFKDSNKTSLAYTNGIGEMTKVMSKMFIGLGEDTEFTQAKIELIMAALEGEEGKLEELQKEAARRSVELIDATQDVKDSLTDVIENTPTDIRYGVSIDASGIDISSLNQKLTEGEGLTDEIRNALETQGWEVVTKTVDGVEVIDEILTKWVGIGTEDWSKILDLEFDIDRYHEVDEILDDISKRLGQIEKIKDRAFGKAKDDALLAQMSLINSEIEASKRKLKEANDYYKKDLEAIGKYGFTVDSSGHINNYEELLPTLTDDERKRAEKAISKYEDSRDKVQELGYEIKNLEYDLNVSKPLELLQQGIDFEIEVKGEAQLKKLNYLIDNIYDSAHDAAEAINAMAESFDVNNNNWQVSQQGIYDLLKMKGATGDQITAFLAGDGSAIKDIAFYDEEIEKLQTLQDNMINYSKEMQTLYDNMHEKLDEVFDELNEDYDNLNKKLEHTASVLESYKNIVDLLGAGNLGLSRDIVNQLSTAQFDVAQSQVSVTTQQLEENRKKLREAIAARDAATNETEREKWQEHIDHFTEAIQENEKAQLEAMIGAFEAAAVIREQSVNQAIDDYIEATTGFKSIDDLRKTYDRQVELSELYVADYEKIHKLSKLTRDIEKSMDDTKSIKGKQALLKLEQRINDAKASGVKLSQYELENLQREYDIELAKIALEQAQNSASTVRLRRDSEGNVSYVYTADEDAVADAYQKYEDAVYASAKANQEWLKQSQNAMIQVEATYAEQMAEINLKVWDSTEERNKAIEELNEWYRQMQEYYTGQTDITLKNNEDLYKGHVETMDEYYDKNTLNFNTMFDDMFQKGTDFNTEFSSTILGGLFKNLLGDEDSAEAYYNKLVMEIGSTENSTGLMGKLGKAHDAFEGKTKNVFENAGLNANTFAQQISKLFDNADSTTPGVKQVIAGVNEELDKLKKQTDFSEAQSVIINMGSKIAKTMKSAQEQTNNLNTALSKFLTLWAQGVTELKDKTLTVTITTENTGGTGGGENEDPEINENPPPKKKMPADYGYSKTGKISEITSFNGVSGVVINNKFYKASDLSSNGFSAGGKYDVGSTVYISDSAKGIDRFIKGEGEATLVGSQATFSKTSFKRLNRLTSNGVVYVQPYNMENSWFKEDDFTKTSSGMYQIKRPYTRYIKQFNTGGYTGTWGPEGRLAMLHQKEIVLNAHDTENLLQIVDIVRQMAAKLDFNALMASRSLDSVALQYQTALSGFGGTLDQNVTIHAEFPNATDRNEIEAAFGDLVNLAAQYANRK